MSRNHGVNRGKLKKFLCFSFDYFHFVLIWGQGHLLFYLRTEEFCYLPPLRGGSTRRYVKGAIQYHRLGISSFIL
jgi:hypothetical protein